ncbi:hypothetical protein N7481_001800 [Penicillium waksmanii]|uniref:uncharacterized protein n=1 Tax=Penicillium waksmanii TaxID=69791 RepID=UPI002547A882|nr:uncharacterized protein N7481_001800 [Penicillium waksmanii]KAJ5994823.1 hypothetical protein N7481_001800 [Penicillium waksmanii]
MAHVDDFIFVNTSNPDRFRDKDIQRTIRKRVMRDIGKARRKSKHTPAVTFVWQPSHPSTRLESPAPCLGSNPLPVEIDSRALELIHFSM